MLNLDEQMNGTPAPRRRRRAAAQEQAFEEFAREQAIAEETVAAVEPGHAHVAAQTKDGADARKGRVAPYNQIQQGAQRCRCCRFDAALAHMERAVGDVHIVGIIRHDESHLFIFCRNDGYYTPVFRN